MKLSVRYMRGGVGGGKSAAATLKSLTSKLGPSCSRYMISLGPLGQISHIVIFESSKIEIGKSMQRHSVKKEVTYSSVRSSLEADATCFVLEGQWRLRTENSSSIKASIDHKREEVCRFSSQSSAP